MVFVIIHVVLPEALKVDTTVGDPILVCWINVCVFPWPQLE